MLVILKESLQTGKQCLSFQISRFHSLYDFEARIHWALSKEKPRITNSLRYCKIFPYCGAPMDTCQRNVCEIEQLQWREQVIRRPCLSFTSTVYISWAPICESFHKVDVHGIRRRLANCLLRNIRVQYSLVFPVRLTFFLAVWRLTRSPKHSL